MPAQTYCDYYFYSVYSATHLYRMPVFCHQGPHYNEPPPVVMVSLYHVCMSIPFKPFPFVYFSSTESREKLIYFWHQAIIAKGGLSQWKLTTVIKVILFAAILKVYLFDNVCQTVKLPARLHQHLADFTIV